MAVKAKVCALLGRPLKVEDVGSDRPGADVGAALSQLRSNLKVTRELIDELIGHGVRPESLAWALAELDQLQATVKEIAARRDSP